MPLFFSPFIKKKTFFIIIIHLYLVCWVGYSPKKSVDYMFEKKE